MAALRPVKYFSIFLCLAWENSETFRSNGAMGGICVARAEKKTSIFRPPGFGFIEYVELDNFFARRVIEAVLDRADIDPASWASSAAR